MATESERIIASFEGGECPDCGEDIPPDVIEGQACDNCGHVFWSNEAVKQAVNHTQTVIMTYRDLLAALQQLTEEQLECNIAVELDASDAVYSSADGSVRFDIADREHELLDENHPVFVLPSC